MSRRLLSLITLVLPLALDTPSAGAASLVAAVQEPVFGLRYAPAKVRFEPLPASVLSACPSLVNERWDRESWIHARQSEGATLRYVIGGRYVTRVQPGPGVPSPASAPQTQPDVQGAVIELGPSGCVLHGPAREVFDSPPAELPAEALDALAADLGLRYRQAFDGQPGLQAALKRQKVDLRRLPARLAKALQVP